MGSLSKDGAYEISDEMLGKIKEIFDAGFADEKGVFDTINEQFESFSYLCDTHTAVAIKVYEDYVKNTGDDIPTVIDSTASPYKFSKSVLSAISGDLGDINDEFMTVDELNKKTCAEVPAPLKALKNKQVRFTEVCSKENMSEMVFKLLNI